MRTRRTIRVCLKVAILAKSKAGVQNARRRCVGESGLGCRVRNP